MAVYLLKASLLMSPGHQLTRYWQHKRGDHFCWCPGYLFTKLIRIPHYIHFKVWDEIAYPFPNFNGCTVEVWEWISNFIPHFKMDIITYPCWDGFSTSMRRDWISLWHFIVENWYEMQLLCSGYTGTFMRDFLLTMIHLLLRIISGSQWLPLLWV